MLRKLNHQHQVINWMSEVRQESRILAWENGGPTLNRKQRRRRSRFWGAARCVQCSRGAWGAFGVWLETLSEEPCGQASGSFSWGVTSRKTVPGTRDEQDYPGRPRSLRRTVGCRCNSGLIGMELSRQRRRSSFSKRMQCVGNFTGQ